MPHMTVVVDFSRWRHKEQVGDFLAHCANCPWEYRTTDRLDARVMARVHAERAGRRVR